MKEILYVLVCIGMLFVFGFVLEVAVDILMISFICARWTMRKLKIIKGDLW